MVRVLAFLAQHPGPDSYRHLAARTGLTKRAVVEAVNTAETNGWLDVVHGRSSFEEQPAKPNVYEVTNLGREQIPEVLQTQPLRGDYALDEGVWSERVGVGIRGMIVALSIDTMTAFGASEVAKVLGTDRRTAAKLLARWASKAELWLYRSEAAYYLLDGEAKHWASAAMEAHAERRFMAEKIDREARLRHLPKSRAKEVLAFEPVMIRFVNEHA